VLNLEVDEIDARFPIQDFLREYRLSLYH